MPRPKPAEEPVQIAVRIAPSLLALIDAEAESSGRSRNAVLADAATAHVQDEAALRAAKKLGAGLNAQRDRATEIKASAGVQLGPKEYRPGDLAKRGQKR